MCQWQWFRSQLDTLFLALLICSRAGAAQHPGLQRAKGAGSSSHLRKRSKTRQAHSIHPTQMWLLPGENSTPAHLSVSVCWKPYAPIHTALFCYCNKKPLPLNLFWEQESTCENSAQAVLQYKAKAKTARRILLHWPNTEQKSSHVRYFISSFFRICK